MLLCLLEADRCIRLLPSRVSGESAYGRITCKSPTEQEFEPRFLIPQNNALITNPHMFPDAQGSTILVMEMSVVGGHPSSWGSALRGGGFQQKSEPLLNSRALYTRQDWMYPWVVSDRIWSWGRKEFQG